MAELTWNGKQQPELTGIPRQLVTEQVVEKTESPAPSHVWHNRLVLGERTDVLRAFLPELAGKVQLIYVDPPFMTGRSFTSGNRLAYHDVWDNNLDTYLQWLYESCCLLYQLLSNTGSLYIHLDWRVTHYARVILDEIFHSTLSAKGPGFKNEIIWHYHSGGHARSRYARKHDTLLLYTKTGTFCFHGERIGTLRGPEKRNHMRKQVHENGQISWSIRSAGKTYTYHEEQQMTPTDVWNDISHLHQRDPERTGYATQKPEALLERILLASTEPEDLVLDCFCGSGVTPAVAERLGRRWLASDQSPLAIDICFSRLKNQVKQYPFLKQRIV